MARGRVATRLLAYACAAVSLLYPPLALAGLAPTGALSLLLGWALAFVYAYYFGLKLLLFVLDAAPRYAALELTSDALFFAILLLVPLAFTMNVTLAWVLVGLAFGYAAANVLVVRRTETGYSVRTDQGDWSCRTLVIASGAFNIACVPGFSDRVPQSVTTLTTQRYRNPDQLPSGGALVVSASSSGTQIANEIHRSGRPGILSVGEHIRAPRVYRGRDL